MNKPEQPKTGLVAYNDLVEQLQPRWLKALDALTIVVLIGAGAASIVGAALVSTQFAVSIAMVVVAVLSPLLQLIFVRRTARRRDRTALRRFQAADLDHAAIQAHYDSVHAQGQRLVERAQQLQLLQLCASVFGCFTSVRIDLVPVPLWLVGLLMLLGATAWIVSYAHREAAPLSLHF